MYNRVVLKLEVSEQLYYDSKIKNEPKKIEIADLMILNYNKSKRELRICFIQAKYKDKFYNNKFISFIGNKYQWELLKDKPDIYLSNKHGYPIHILNFRKDYESITAYGVFYKDKVGKIDFLFTLPERLEFTSMSSMTFKALGICPNGNYKKYITKKEATCICKLDNFEGE